MGCHCWSRQNLSAYNSVRRCSIAANLRRLLRYHWFHSVFPGRCPLSPEAAASPIRRLLQEPDRRLYMPALSAIARAARSVLFGCRTDRAHYAGRSPATAWSSSAPRTSFAWEAMFASCARSEPSFITSCVMTRCDVRCQLRPAHCNRPRWSHANMSPTEPVVFLEYVRQRKTQQILHPWPFIHDA